MRHTWVGTCLLLAWATVFLKAEVPSADQNESDTVEEPPVPPDVDEQVPGLVEETPVVNQTEGETLDMTGEGYDCAGENRDFCLSLIYNCSWNFWTEISYFEVTDPFELLTSGCTAWQNYMDCLSELKSDNGTINLPSGTYHIDNDNNATIVVENEDNEQGIAVHLESNDTWIDSDQLNTTDESATDQNGGGFKKLSLLSGWRLYVLTTGAIYRDTGLCPNLDTSGLGNLMIDRIGYESQDESVTPLLTEEAECFGQDSCFSELFGANFGSLFPCDPMTNYVRCMQSQKEECPEGVLDDLVEMLVEITQPMVDSLKQIPGMCEEDHP